MKQILKISLLMFSMFFLSTKLALADIMVGNSYYGWSISMPKGCEVTKVDQSGKSVFVQNRADDYSVYIYSTYSNSISTDQQLLDELLSYVGKETVVSKSSIKVADRKWASVVLKNNDQISEYRASIKNNRIYQIHMYSSNKNDKQRKTILDSFKLDYPKNNKTIQDLNKIKSGLYTYTDNKLGWSISLPPWLNIDIALNGNSIEILDERGKSNIYFHIEYNPVQNQSKTEKFPANQYSTLELDDNSVLYTLYKTDGKYNYKLSLYADKDPIYDKILSSFKLPPVQTSLKITQKVKVSYLEAIKRLTLYFTML